MTTEHHKGLNYIVECHDGMGGFEPIAAFNVGRVAARYAGDCRKSNPRNKYRVMMLADTPRPAYVCYEGTS